MLRGLLVVMKPIHVLAIVAPAMLALTACDPVVGPLAVAITNRPSDDPSVSPPPPPLPCQDGTWLVAGEVISWKFGNEPSIGIEQATLQFTTVPEALAENVVAYDIQSQTIFVPELGMSAVVAAVEPIGEIGLVFNGLYRLLDSSRSIRFHGETLAYDCDSFAVELEVEVYDGDVLTEIEIEPGVFSWDIDPDALPVAIGTYRLDGIKQ